MLVFINILIFQLKDFVPASSAAFTYHVANPDSVIMKDNIHWYSNKLDNKTDFVNREPFVSLGNSGNYAHLYS